MSTTDQIIVSCPNCQKEITWDEQHKFRPFCCERCKLIDLGEWAAEKHKIPGDSINSEPDFEFNMLDNDSYLQ